MKSLQQVKIGTFSFRKGVSISEVESALEQFHFHLLRLRDCRPTVFIQWSEKFKRFGSATELNITTVCFLMNGAWYFNSKIWSFFWCQRNCDLHTCFALHHITSQHNPSSDRQQPHRMVQNLTFNGSWVSIQLWFKSNTVREASKNETMPRLRKSTLFRLIVILLAGGPILLERSFLDIVAIDQNILSPAWITIKSNINGRKMPWYCFRLRLRRRRGWWYSRHHFEARVPGWSWS